MTALTNANPLASVGTLDDFQPKTRPAASDSANEIARAEKAAVKQVAQDNGFVIDNLSSTIVRAKRTSNAKASTSRTMRLYVSDINRFQSWCNANNYSQAKGFEIILDRVLPKPGA